MTTPNAAQLAKIADCIFVMRDRKTTRLPKPKLSGPAAFQTALDRLKPNFENVGIGVIDFTRDAMHPDVWLHNEDKGFRIGSASKIAMMLAAVQLRLDVRTILALSPQIITTAAEFDAAFANPDLWNKGKLSGDEQREFVQMPPLISKIFDFTKTPIDFLGPDPSLPKDAAKQKAIMDKLPADHELAWETTPPLAFSERLWLTGARSDNVAATACVCEIGLPYLKAVQRSYGLSDDAKGMHLLASAGYAPFPAKPELTPMAPRRLPWKLVQTTPVEDFWLNPNTGQFDDKRSWVPGSAAALSAYVIALMTDAFADPGGVMVAGLDACTVLRNNLAALGGESIQSFLVSGPKADGRGGVASIATINELHNKIGILNESDKRPKYPILCEVVFMETQEFTAPPTGRNKMRYAIVVCGLMASPGVASPVIRSPALGIAVHQALLKL